MAPEPTNTTIESLLAHASWLDALARRLVSDPNEADEIVQETWVTALSQPPRHAAQLRAWMARVARNLAVDRGRSERARKEREQSTARTEASTADRDALDRARTLRRLVDAVLALGEPYRSTIVLHYFERMSIAEVAVRQAVPESTVRTRMWRAIGTLRERFRHEEGDAWSLAFVAFVAKPAANLHVVTSRTAVGTSGAWIGGIAMATAWKIGASLAAVIVLGWVLWPKHDDSIAHGLDVARGTEKPVDSLSPDGNETARRTALAGTQAGEKAEAAGTPKTDRASLDVLVKWGDDGTSAAGVVVGLLQFGAADPMRGRIAQATDAQGLAHFESVVAGGIIVQVDRCKSKIIDLVQGEKGRCEVVIPDGTDVDVHVIDERGASVPHARIWISTGSQSDGLEIGNTDASGNFHVRDLGQGAIVAALCDGYGPSTQARVEKDPTKSVVAVQLELTTPLGLTRGVVRDAKGTPIAGADVELLSRNDAFTQRPASETGYFPPVHVQSDATGAFEARDLRRADVWVTVRSAGFVTWKGTIYKGLEDRILDVRMRPQAVVHGFLRGEDGKPIAHARVGTGPDLGLDTSSRADGSYRLECLPARRIELHVDAFERGSIRRTFELKEGDDVAWDVSLHPNASVTGRVEDKVGRPLSNWRVSSVGDEYREVHTDSDGRFEIHSWPDEAYAIEVREPNGLLRDPAVSRGGIKPGARDLVLVVRDEDMGTARMIGRILGPDGTGLSGTEMFLHQARSNSSFIRRADHEGRFEILGLRPGSYWIEITPDHAPAKELHGLEILAPGQTLDLGDVGMQGSGGVNVLVRLPPGVDRADDPPWLMLGSADWSYMRQFLLRPRAGGLEGTLDGIPAGEYVIVMKDFLLRTDVVRVEIRVGHTEDIEMKSDLGAMRPVKMAWSADGPQPKVVYLRAYDDSNTEVYYSAYTQGMTSGGVLNLRVGTYRVEATTDVGIRAEAELKIEVLGMSKDELRLELK